MLEIAVETQEDCFEQRARLYLFIPDLISAGGTRGKDLQNRLAEMRESMSVMVNPKENAVGDCVARSVSFSEHLDCDPSCGEGLCCDGTQVPNAAPEIYNTNPE